MEPFRMGSSADPSVLTPKEELQACVARAEESIDTARAAVQAATNELGAFRKYLEKVEVSTRQQP